MIKEIILKNRQDAEKLNKLASEKAFNVNVSCGHLVLDAKSLLALFAIVGKKVNLVVPDHLKVSQFYDLINDLGL